jgi:hypothetical protein
MPKPRPVEVHPHSMGAKRLKLQEMIHDEEAYYFIGLDGSTKTDLYNKGFLDGRKRPVQLHPYYEDCNNSTWVLALKRKVVRDKVQADNFVSILPLNETFVIVTREAERFKERYCQDCEFAGSSKCFLEADFDCAEEERDSYKDGDNPFLIEERAERLKRRKSRHFQ